MRIRITSRLERLEARTAAKKRLTVRFGNLKKLPREYQGERHVVSVSQQTAGMLHPGWYEFEERLGPAPRGTDPDPDDVLTVYFVGVDRSE